MNVPRNDILTAPALRIIKRQTVCRSDRGLIADLFPAALCAVFRIALWLFVGLLPCNGTVRDAGVPDLADLAGLPMLWLLEGVAERLGINAGTIQNHLYNKDNCI